MDDKFLESLKPNSEYSKKETEKVAEHRNVKIRRKSFIRKAVEVFLVEDIRAIKDYWIDNSVLPTLKNDTYAIISDLFSYIFKGVGSNPSHNQTASYRNVSPKTTYSYNTVSYQRPKASTTSGHGYFNYDEIEFDSMSEAQDALDNIRDTIAKYNVCSVAEYFRDNDSRNITIPWTYDEWGWYQLDEAIIPRWNGRGYILPLPKPVPIK